MTADRQTAGRGRLDRVWRDTPGESLLFSTLLRPECPPEVFQVFPIAAGLAIARAVGELYAIDARLKWPNDVLASDDRKLAGVLVTSRVKAGKVESATIGIGINTLGVPAELPGAIALQDLTSRAVDRRAVLDAVLRHLEDLYVSVLEGESASIAASWTGCAAWIGEWVEIRASGAILTGRQVGIDRSGRLLLVQGEDVLTSIAVGDVSRGMRRVRNATEM